MTRREIDTPSGPARAHLRLAERPLGALVLGPGASGAVDVPDLSAAADAALESRFSIVLVEPPHRVAGRRAPAPAKQLDAAWIAVLEELRRTDLGGLSLVTGGRSAGARVACRTAAEVGAAGVLCLAFPVHAPGKGGDPSKSRIGELDGVDVPVLVVQGTSDPFGMPADGAGRTIVKVPGGHNLKGDLGAITEAVKAWLPKVVG